MPTPYKTLHTTRFCKLCVDIDVKVTTANAAKLLFMQPWLVDILNFGKAEGGHSWYDTLKVDTITVYKVDQPQSTPAGLRPISRSLKCEHFQKCQKSEYFKRFLKKVNTFKNVTLTVKKSEDQYDMISRFNKALTRVLRNK